MKFNDLKVGLRVKFNDRFFTGSISDAIRNSGTNIGEVISITPEGNSSKKATFQFGKYKGAWNSGERYWEADQGTALKIINETIVINGEEYV